MPRILRSPVRPLFLLAILSGAPMGAAAQSSVVVPAGVSQASYALNAQQIIFNDPVIVWYERAACADDPTAAGLPAGTAPGSPGDETRPSVIWRGSTSLATPRKFFEHNPTRPVGTCNPHRMLSNVAVDATHVYYVDNLGPGGRAAIWKRSRSANVGDPSQLLVDLAIPASELTGGEILVFGTSLFAIFHLENGFDILSRYHRDTGVLIADAIDGGAANTLRNLQQDGTYVYWMNDHELWGYDLALAEDFFLGDFIATYLAGPEQIAIATLASPSGAELYTVDLVSGSFALLYTAPPNASIGPIASGQFGYFFFTQGPAPFGGPFDREYRLLRLTPPGAPQLILGPFLNVPGYDAFTTDFSFLYFRDVASRSLLRLPTDAAAIPVRRLRATGLEITQGIQGPNNPVDLYSGRRTFARLHVRSDGPTDVLGVGATLDVSGPEGFLGRLEPVNGVNKRLTVRRETRRARLDDSFLFELPLAWTELAFLSFSATVNPTAAIVEDLYNDNTAQTPILNVLRSSRLPLEIITWWYNSGGNLISGALGDNLRSERHLRNLYPIAYVGGGIAQPGGGLRTSARVIVDDELTDQVDRTDTTCNNMRGPTPAQPTDNRNQCAGDYVMGRVRAMKADGTLANDRYYYSSIAGDATTLFTRGYAIQGDRAACGPQTDNNPQQNYMAHEVGHLLGRGHPNSGAAPVCPGQDASDPGYPYPQARIGASTTAANDDGALMGLDFGEILTSAKVIRTSSATGDTMSYCNPYWVSDHTYNALGLFLALESPFGAALPRAAGAPRAAAVPGDWLAVNGLVSQTGNVASFASVRRLPSVAEVPVLIDGGLALELRSAAGALLARHAFTADPIEDGAPGFGSYGLVVPFAPGTRSLRLVKGAGSVLATHAVSANPPQVSDVALVGAPSPVTGTARVEWVASDPDGDALRYDLFYSHDAGASWRPVHLSLREPRVDVDTEVLPGGTGRFRVEASDGALVARAESSPFEITRKPARVSIDSPTEGTRIDWGQLVNFVASVDDVQGGVIPPANITWSNAYRTLGKGPVVSVSDLEVGTNVVTVSVVDSSGLPTFATITVQVGDSVLPPGPRLSASPATIAWQVPGNVSTVVESKLLVRNAGGGDSLFFRITSDRPWLRVNGQPSVETSADQELTVTADASGLADAAVTEGTLSITNLSAPADTLSVRVAVAKGDVVGGRVRSDQDGDGVEDDADVCVLAADGPTLPGSPALVQRDTNGDGFGNVCDADLNGDGLVNFADLQILKQRFFGSNPDADLNGDGLVNFGDLVLMKAAFFQAPGPSAKAP